MGSKYNNSLIDFIEKEFGDKEFQFKDIKNPKIRKLAWKHLFFKANQPNTTATLFEIVQSTSEKGNAIKKFKLKNGVK